MPGKKDHEYYSCFLAQPAGKEYEKAREAVIKGAEAAGFKVVTFDSVPVFQGNPQQIINRLLSPVDCVIADISSHNPNVFFEFGMDEPITNARQYFNKPGKRIEFSASQSFPWPLPDFLDSQKIE